MVARNTLTKELIESRCEKIPFSGCWVWMGSASTTRGYGSLCVEGRHIKAHQAAWEAYRGSRGSLHVLHGCDVPACCNPAHLFLGTHQDNMADRERKGRNKAPPTSSPHHPHFNKRYRKLSDDAAREIMLAKSQVVIGGRTAEGLAEKFGVKVRAIYKIWEGKLWGHLWAS